MAFARFIPSALSARRFAARLFAPLIATARYLDQWQQAYASKHALMTLSDRELADIGLNRGDIDRLGNDQLLG